MSITLSQYLTTAVQNNLIDSELSALISAVAQLSKDINDKVTHGALAGVLGMHLL